MFYLLHFLKVPSVEKQGVEFDKEGLIDVEVEDETDSDEELQPDYGSKSEKEFLSPTDDDDPAWTSGLVTSSEDNLDKSLEEDLEVENDVKITLNWKTLGNLLMVWWGNLGRL